MRRLVRNSASLFLLIWCLAYGSIAQKPAAQTASSLDDLQVAAPSLAGNLLGDTTSQHVFVYLPPSYATDTSKRYPTLYLLHGFGGRPEAWIGGAYQGMRLQSEMDSLIAKGSGSEMIVVVPNGRNANLGSFYTNSVVTGKWEDYIFRDLVSYIDGRYRTLAKPASRGIAGHSMGGYGAFMLAMKHPDVFGAVYSLSPCCIGMEADLTADNRSWGRAAATTSRDIFSKPPGSIDDFWVVAMIALSSAFSPNTERAPLFVDLPYATRQGTLVRNETAFSNFRANMPLYLVEQNRENLMKLRGIFLDVGEFDEFSHIRFATAKLSGEMSAREIPHTFELYRGGDHSNKIRERFNTKVIPFFSSVLEK